MSSSSGLNGCNTSLVYLDNNATTPVLPQVAEAVIESMHTTFGNPSSSHITGLKAKHLMEVTRQLGLKLLGSTSGNLMFTSGATEGIQTAVLSALVNYMSLPDKKATPVLLYGATEHKAVPNTLLHWNQLLGIGAQVKAIPVDSRGKLDLAFIERHIDQAVMVCTMAVNNETGVYQDLAQLQRVIKGAVNPPLWMVDSVQALGKLSLNMDTLAIDYAPFSGHKLYGPKGVGFLYVKQGAPVTPFIAGGGQESGLRSGTENIHGIAALKVIFNALLEHENTFFVEHKKLHVYRDKLVNSLKRVFPDIVFNHAFGDSVPTTINFSVKGFSSKEIMDLFDAANIRVSSGSACSSGVTRSFVLDAMGVDDWRSESAIRLSFGPAMTERELNIACERIESLADVLSKSCLVASDNTDTVSEIRNGLIQFRHNGWLSWMFIDKETREAVVIDPYAQHAERIEALVKCQGIKVLAVVDTHTHNDRQSVRQDVAGIVNTALDSQDSLGWPTHNDSFSLGRYCFTRLSTPGHSRDSHSYLLSKDNKVMCAFVGDLLIPGGFGRTDLDNSEPESCLQSLQKLAKAISPETLICSAHDYANLVATDFQTELNTNSLLRDAIYNDISLPAFLAQKRQLDASLSQNSTYLCGQISASSVSDDRFQRTVDEVKTLLRQHRDVKVLDVREVQENEATNLSRLLSIPQAHIVSAPISRIGDWLLSGQADRHAHYLVLCRSGSRSMVVCKALHRMGFTHLMNIKGGLALLAS